MVKHVVIVDPGRTGTHYLYNTMKKHFLHIKKEMRFFSVGVNEGKYPNMSRNEYISAFTSSPAKDAITIDASPVYFQRHVPHRILIVLGKENVFVIGGIKNPMKRYISAFIAKAKKLGTQSLQRMEPKF